MPSTAGLRERNHIPIKAMVRRKAPKPNFDGDPVRLMASPC
jgi:hypothetical protein